MSKIGFKVTSIQKILSFGTTRPDFPPLIPLVLSIKAAISNGIKEKSEDAQSTKSFLKEKTIEGLQDFNKVTNGILSRMLTDENIEVGDLMLAIRNRRPGSEEDWIKIRQTSRGDKNFRIYFNLKKFGMIIITVVTKIFNIGSNGTLTHRVCCDIASRLIRGSLGPCPIYYYKKHVQYYKYLQTRWERKISALNGELPKTLQDQLRSTMQWMLWNDILV